MEGQPSHGRYPNKIRQLRMEKDLTQQELAFIMGYSLGSLSHLEMGKKRPMAETIARLEAAFQRPFRDIYPEFFDPIYDPVAERRAAFFRKREEQQT